IGKHIDQDGFDEGHKIRTLPVLLGEPRSRFLNQVLVAGMYLLVALAVFFRLMTPWALLVFLNLPSAWRLLKVCSAPRPSEAPAGWIGWPLWLHRFNLVHNRRFGWLYLLGLGAGAAWNLWGQRLFS
ncbi:MAG: prenyltransferase, partial [Spirochaetales bacterium]|nr:prenyltransferase [Spirochaetales bacterium]